MTGLLHVKDMMGRDLSLPQYPKRIISLVPSQTELLYHLGLDEAVVGITKFCIHPEEWWRTKTRVGGTKTVNLDTIKSLQPDLVICNKEENTEQLVKDISSFCPVWLSDIVTLDDALKMIKSLGTLLQKTTEAESISRQIRSGFEALQAHNSKYKPVSVAYCIWRNPWMTAAGGTFIDDILKRLHCRNVCAHLTRYPQLEIEELAQLKPEYIFLSSEPYPFKEKHIEELQGFFPDSKILLTDGENFSWYGSRLLHAVDYLKQLSRQIFS